MKLKFFVILTLGSLIISYMSPYQALERLSGIFYGKLDQSSNTRLEAWSAGYAGFEKHPFGNGLGSFSHENIYGILDGYSIPLEYPHNFIIEALYESGIIFFIFMSCLILISLLKMLKNSTIRNSWLPNVYIFMIVNSLFSSDIPGNKEMWIFMMLILNAGLYHADELEKQWESSKTIRVSL